MDKLSRRNLFELMDDYSKYNYKKAYLKSFIIKYISDNPNELYSTNNGMTIYSYAVGLGLKAVQAIYEGFLVVQDELELKMISPQEFKSKNGYCPIHYAIEFNNSDILLFLINTVGVNVNSQDKSLNTPLHLACIYRRERLLKILLFNSAANINMVNNYYQTPLMICIVNNEKEMIKDLLGKNAKLIIRDTINNLILDIEYYVNNYSNSEIRMIFKKHKKSIRLKEKKKLLKIRHSRNKNKEFEEYNFLCNSLNDDSNIELVRYTGKKFKIQNVDNLNKIELCQAISKHIIKSGLMFKLKS
jgi:hypothetical protein